MLGRLLKHKQPSGENDTPSRLEMGLLTKPASPQNLKPNLFSHLPDEILSLIISCLAPKDIALSASRLDRRFQRICSQYLFNTKTPEFLRWQIGFFQHQRKNIQESIEDEDENLSSCKSLSLLWSIGGLCTTASGYAVKNLSSTNRPVSTDEKILVAIFFLVSLAILVTGLVKSIRCGASEYRIHGMNQEIDTLDDKIEINRKLLNKSPSKSN